ncbi:MAG: helix-turn-helix transcriptional regulator [Rhodanobacteraceae bacterium]
MPKTKKIKGTEPATAVAFVLLRLPQVSARTGLSRSELYRRMAGGDFPAQVKIGVRASAWNAAEIDHWVAARIAERDATAAA